MNYRRTAVAMAAALLMAAGALSACASGSNGQKAPSTASGGASASMGGIDLGATLRYDDPLPITTLDPQQAPGAASLEWIYPVYARLLSLTPDLKLAPGLATSWDVSSDGLTIDMTLRSDATFADGTPFNADAVVATVQRGKDDPKSRLVADLAAVKTVTAVDKTHVRLNLSEPDSSLLYSLAQGAGCMISPKAIKDGANLALHPAGVGAYTLSQFVPGQTATYVRNSDFYDPSLAGAAKMVFKTVSSSAQRLNDLKSGSADVTFLDATDVPAAKQAGLNVDPAESTEYFHLQLNRKIAPLDNVKVRQAINYAIDRKALVTGLLHGLGSPSDQPFRKGTAGYVESLENAYPHDVAKAKQLLKEAGYPDGIGFQILTLNLPTYLQGAQAIQQQLAEAGIKVSIKQTSSVSQTFYVEQKGQSTFVQWIGRPDPADTIGLLFTSTGLSNPGRGSIPQIDALYKQLLKTSDGPARQELVEQINKLVTENAMDVVLYYPDSNLASTSKVKNLKSFADGVQEFTGVGLSK